MPFILENIISLLPLIMLTNPGTETTDTSLVREGALYRTKRSNSNLPSTIGITSPAVISFLLAVKTNSILPALISSYAPIPLSKAPALSDFTNHFSELLS